VLRGPIIRERRFEADTARFKGPLRPFVLGVAFGAAWTPCVGPLLGAALTVAARSGQAGRGAVLLFAYALGIGVPFLLASLGLASSPALAGWLRRAGPRVERLAGGLLVVLGLLLATGTYGHLTSYLARFTPTVGGL
jgi:cytochrome c-type biogenesis protein